MARSERWRESVHSRRWNDTGLVSLGLLRHNRDFALVWFGGLISLTGDWMLYIGLPVYVYQVTGSALSTSIMLAMWIVPRLVFGSVAGVFVDRWDLRTTLIVVNLIQCVAVSVLLLTDLVDGLWLVYVVAFVQSTCSQFVVPAEGALLPRLVSDEQLHEANSLNALNNNAARLIGPPLGGFVIGAGGLGGAAGLDAVTFLIAALLLLFTSVRTRTAPVPQVHTEGDSWQRLCYDWLAGLRTIRRTRALAVALAFIAITSVGEGVVSVLLAPFVLDVLGGDAVGVGALFTAQSLGGLLASLLLSGRMSAWQPARMVGLGAIGLGVIDVMVFNYSPFLPGILPALVLLGLVGFPVTVMVVGFQSLVQILSLDAYLGRVLGALNTMTAISSLVGAGLAGAATPLLGIVVVLNIQCLGYLMAGFLVLVVLQPRATESSAKDPAS